MYYYIYVYIHISIHWQTTHGTPESVSGMIADADTFGSAFIRDLVFLCQHVSCCAHSIGTDTPRLAVNHRCIYHIIDIGLRIRLGIWGKASRFCIQFFFSRIKSTPHRKLIAKRIGPSRAVRKKLGDGVSGQILLAVAVAFVVQAIICRDDTHLPAMFHQME